MIAEWISEFHFLRPEWFWALIPAAILYVLARVRQRTESNWTGSIDNNLLPYLLSGSQTVASRAPLLLVLVAWIFAIAALAGPVWRKTPQPIHEREDALVIILDLTGSMYAEDVSPNRLIRARRKLHDLLDRRSEGVTGLIVFAGDAHTVSPLTDDANTIAEMIPAIAPDIMPSPGSQLTPALELAIELFEDAGTSSGRILIITDEIRDVAESQALARQYRGRYPVSVLAVGTIEGAPIPLPDGSGFVKNNAGVIVMPGLDVGLLADFAANAGGRFSRMTLTDEDLDYLLTESVLSDDDAYRTIDRDFDIWIEEGPWIVLLLLPLAALAFRRGWIWSVMLVCILPSQDVSAASAGQWWDNLWLTPDQQGVQALRQGAPDRAATLFEDPAWKGSAQYRSGQFEAAAARFSELDTADGYYNLGNSLAHMGRLEEAITAYNQAIEIHTDHEDAIFNKSLVEELLKQNQQQQPDQGNEQDNQASREEQSQDSSSNSDENTSEEEQQSAQSSEDQDDSRQEQEQEQTQEQAAEEQPSDGQQQEEQQMAQVNEEDLDEEQRQALEQWLRRVPDDPGGLLRRKFELQHEERNRNRITTNEQTKDW